MKYSISLILTFAIACLGWSLVLGGPVVLGLLVLALCFSFAYWMSVHLAFGSFRNLFKEMETWHNMIP